MTWTLLEKILTGVAVLTIAAIALTYLGDGEVGTFVAYLLSLFLFFPVSPWNYSVHSGAVGHAGRGRGVCGLFRGGHAVAFIVVFVLSLVALARDRRCPFTYR